MSIVSEAMEFMAKLMTKTPWGDVAGLLPELIKDIDRVSEEFVKFLKNNGRVINGDLKITTAQFDPVKLIGEGWTFWKGPKDGNGLEGEEERNKASLALATVDFANAEFVICLSCRERDEHHDVDGEEKLKRLKELGLILYDSTVLMGLWQNYQECQDKADSVLEKLYQQKDVIYIDFFADILRSPEGIRYVQYLYRRGSGQWRYFCSPLSDNCAGRGLSGGFPTSI